MQTLSSSDCSNSVAHRYLVSKKQPLWKRLLGAFKLVPSLALGIISEAKLIPNLYIFGLLQALTLIGT